MSEERKEAAVSSL